MPDLTIVPMQQCSSLEQHTAEIGGYHQWNLFEERAYPACSCPAYKYAKRTVNFGGRLVPPPCKHIEEAEAEVCGWHELTGDPSQEEEGICPRCGAPTVTVHVGV